MRGARSDLTLARPHVRRGAAEHVGRRLTLSGWADTRRDHGGLVFVDLRDRSGLCQLVLNPERAPEAAATGHSVRNEFVLRAEGELVRRAPEAVNPNIPTGEVELQVDSLEIVSRAPALPFQLDEEGVDETLRLRYRWLDLRRPRMQRNIAVRAQLVGTIRRVMEEAGLPRHRDADPLQADARRARATSSSRAGCTRAASSRSRSRRRSSSSSSSIAGFDRYYQIAICFRDEDLRADRVQEITPARRRDGLPGPGVPLRAHGAHGRDGLARVPRASRCRRRSSASPTPRPLGRYGSDKPDLRFGLEIQDVTEVTRGSEFGVFAKAPAVRFLVVPQAFSRSELAALEERAKELGREGPRLPRGRRGRGGALADRQVPLGARARGASGPSPGSTVLFGADEPAVVARVLGALRLELGRDARPDRRGRVAAGLGHRLPDVRVGRGRGALGRRSTIRSPAPRPARRSSSRRTPARRMRSPTTSS